MQNTWLILLPPIIALFLSVITRKVRFSLIIGIVSAAFIAKDFSMYEAMKASFSRLLETSSLRAFGSWEQFWSSYNLLIFIFLLILGMIIALINKTGATSAYSNFIRKRIKSARGAESASLLLSSLLIVDDYLSCLTTGVVMRPLTDRLRIPRVKLAFLVDSMAASLCVLSPVSSWFAAIIAPLRGAGVTDTTLHSTVVTTDTFWVFVNTIPFIFYSFVIVFSTWLVVLRRISFGLMKRHEEIARETGNIHGGGAEHSSSSRRLESVEVADGSIFDFVLPLIVLMSSVFGSLLYSGGYRLFGGNNSLIQAFQASEISVSLFIGGLATLVVSIGYFFVRKRIRVHMIPSIFSQGVGLIFPSITILVLAWTLGGFLQNDLNIGQFLAQNLIGSFDVRLVPFIFFITSLVISVTTGSAWGTIAIMFPIGVPMIIALYGFSGVVSAVQIPLLFPMLGAIISGAIAGDHISPISDTTIMSSASAGVTHMDHVRSQITYSIPIVIAVGIAFLLSGFLISYGRVWSVMISLIVGLLSSASVFLFMNYWNKKKFLRNNPGGPRLL